MQTKLISVIVGQLILSGVVAAQRSDDSTIARYLRERSQTPVEYVISKAATHRITVIGEGHWLKQDVNLVEALIPQLQKADIDLASELFPASEQTVIDNLITTSSWNEQTANAVMRSASWPYREYRDLLRAAWSVNQNAQRKIKIVALGPPEDWRNSLLPRGITYESFMADLVNKHVSETRRRVVVYCGMHHAFTRYYQAELDNAGNARAYMDRMGNILSRRFGQQVFLIALHKPVWCGNPAAPSYSYCLPFTGRLDCEASKVGRSIGFDVIGSPLADLRFPSDDYYSYGHSDLRFVDYTDGYIWSGPIESFQSVAIIPLNEYATDSIAMKQVTQSNPFNDEKAVSAERLAEIWAQQTETIRDLLANRKWKHLVDWKRRCP
jgi:hypothetical protein